MKNQLIYSAFLYVIISFNFACPRFKCLVIGRNLVALFFKHCAARPYGIRFGNISKQVDLDEVLYGEGEFVITECYVHLKYALRYIRLFTNIDKLCFTVASAKFFFCKSFNFFLIEVHPYSVADKCYDYG